MVILLRSAPSTQPRSQPRSEIHSPISQRKNNGHFLVQIMQRGCAQCTGIARLACNEWKKNVVFDVLSITSWNKGSNRHFTSSNLIEIKSLFKFINLCFKLHPFLTFKFMENFCYFAFY